MRSLLALLLLISVSSAAETDPANQALQHLEEGNKLFHLGSFFKAAEEYKLAYHARPHPDFLFNTAQALRMANDFQGALFFYRSFLSADPKARSRREVEQRIAALEREVKAQRQDALEPPTGTVTPTIAIPPPAPVTRPPFVARTSAVSTMPPMVVVKEPARLQPRRSWWPWAVAGAVVVVGITLGVGLGVGLADTGPKANTSFHF